jgi:hypothetical protein
MLWDDFTLRMMKQTLVINFGNCPLILRRFLFLLPILQPRELLQTISKKPSYLTYCTGRCSDGMYGSMVPVPIHVTMVQH